MSFDLNVLLNPDRIREREKESARSARALARHFVGAPEDDKSAARTQRRRFGVARSIAADAREILSTDAYAACIAHGLIGARVGRIAHLYAPGSAKIVVRTQRVETLIDGADDAPKEGRSTKRRGAFIYGLNGADRAAFAGLLASFARMLPPVRPLLNDEARTNVRATVHVARLARLAIVHGALGFFSARRSAVRALRALLILLNGRTDNPTGGDLPRIDAREIPADVVAPEPIDREESRRALNVDVDGACAALAAASKGATQALSEILADPDDSGRSWAQRAVSDAAVRCKSIAYGPSRRRVASAILHAAVDAWKRGIDSRHAELVGRAAVERVSYLAAVATT